MIEVDNDQGLNDQLKKHIKVVAFFCASWCPFCDLFTPVFEKHSSINTSVKFIRVYVDEDNNPLWEKYSIESVPTVILFEHEKVSNRLDGRLGSGIGERQFSEWLKKT
jgi:thioredoxin 1